MQHLRFLRSNYLFKSSAHASLIECLSKIKSKSEQRPVSRFRKIVFSLNRQRREGDLFHTWKWTEDRIDSGDFNGCIGSSRRRKYRISQIDNKGGLFPIDKKERTGQVGVKNRPEFQLSSEECCQRGNSTLLYLLFISTSPRFRMTGSQR